MTPLPSLSEIATRFEGEPLTPAEIDEQVEIMLGQRPDGVLWVPANEGAAAWAMDKLRALNDELAEVVAHKALLIQQIEGWFELRTKNPTARARLFAAALEAFGLRWAAEDEKRRTLHLAGGGAVAVTVPKSPTVTVTDEAAVLRWARENATEGQPPRPGPQDCINTKPDTLYISEVRKWVRPVEREVESDTCECGHERDEHTEDGTCTARISYIGADEQDTDPCGCGLFEPSEVGTVFVGVYPPTGEVVPGVVVEPPGPPHARVVL
jgi:hypothetical protein